MSVDSPVAQNQPGSVVVISDRIVGDSIESHSIDQQLSIITPTDCVGLSSSSTPVTIAVDRRNADTSVPQPAIDGAPVDEYNFNEESVSSEPELVALKELPRESFAFEALPSDNGFWDESAKFETRGNLSRCNDAPTGYDGIPFADDDSDSAYGDGHACYQQYLSHTFVPVQQPHPHLGIQNAPYSPVGFEPVDMSQLSQPDEHLHRASFAISVIPGQPMPDVRRVRARAHDRSPSPGYREVRSHHIPRINSQDSYRDLQRHRCMPRSISSPGYFRDQIRQPNVGSPISSPCFSRQRSVMSPLTVFQYDESTSAALHHRSLMSPVSNVPEYTQRLVVSPGPNFDNQNLHVIYDNVDRSTCGSPNVGSRQRTMQQRACMSPGTSSTMNGMRTSVNRRMESNNGTNYHDVDHCGYLHERVMSPVRSINHRGIVSPVPSDLRNSNHRSLKSPVKDQMDANGPSRVMSPVCGIQIGHQSSQNPPDRSKRVAPSPNSGSANGDIRRLYSPAPANHNFVDQPEMSNVTTRKPPTPATHFGGRPPAPPPRESHSVNRFNEIQQQILSSRHCKENGNNEDFEELQDRCQRLEGDKENLTLQVSVLNDQIEALNDKMKDLDMIVKEKQEHLNNAEEMLQHELLNKSTLESSKLDMMSNLSELKLKITHLEKKNIKLEDKVKHFEIDYANLKLKLLEKESEIASLHSKYAKMSGKSPVDSSTENEQLQKTINALMASNIEKDQKIEEMRRIYMKNKKLTDIGEFNLSSKNGISHIDDEMSDSALATTPSSSRKSETESPIKTDHKISDKPPPIPRHGPSSLTQISSPTATSTPIHSISESPTSTENSDLHRSQNKLEVSSLRNQPSRLQRANSAEEINVPNKTPPVRARHGIKHYGTVPRQHAANLLEQLEKDMRQHHGKPSSKSSERQQTKDLKPNKSSGISFGKGFLKLRTSKRSSSAPNLAAGESTPEIFPESQNSNTLRPNDLSPQSKEKSKGFKKFFGKLRRSSSGGFDHSEFKRGGMRATAGPRLGWSTEIQKVSPVKTNLPFSEWDKEQVALWLHSIGLSMYIGDCKRWIKKGAQLLKARPHQYEKEMGMKNSLHRKKLHLALQAVSTENSCQDNALIRMGELDYHWVTRWLDDIGIPQYKDVFNDARIDGRVLHNLTVEDLFSLKITNLLHHLSIKRGIQALRFNNFNGNCLRRRPIPGESTKFKLNEVALWTNHRVMEWLRSVDLSEYAPNLRGSGVHGALMVYETKFNTDLLATLLSIPPSKTLLRRHLNTHFKELLGIDTIQEKRDLEIQSNFISLMPSAKVKAVRRGQFSLKKKSKTDAEFEDYVCPMSIKCLSEMEDEKETERSSVKQIEAVSDEIDTLTTMLKDESFLANMTATNV